MSVDVVQATAVEPLNVIGEAVRVLRAAEGPPQFEVFLQEGAEGIGPPPHSHAWDEAYFVLEGELEVFLAGELVRLRAGDFLCVPAGTLHGYTNRAARTRMLSITGGPGAARFFRAMDREVAFPPDFAVAVAVAARNGVDVAPPPAA